MHPIFKIIPFILVFFGVVWLIQMFANKDILIVFLSFSISLPVIYLIIDRFVQKNRLLNMRQEALRAEVALLKNQINPHFFFNTLNNLYGLAAAKSDLAPAMILKLSEIMRFTIYEGKKDHVPLEDEISYLANYLDLQRIRSRAHQVEVRFTHEVVNPSLLVPPLMFIMLVENAFKHGVGSLTEEAFVHIDLQASAKAITFCVTNNFAPAATEKTPGIGLQNLQRRLAILFPNRHQFETRVEAGVFATRLELEL